MSTDGGPGICVAMLSRSGGREPNEDAGGYWLQGSVCCALSDGAGGHGGGDVAARTAVSIVLKAFESDPRCDKASAHRLMDLANAGVLSARRPTDRTRDMRATLTVWLCDPQASRAIWAHSGDTRLYWFRAGRERLRTQDHSLYQAMIDSGMTTESDARWQPQRNLLTASLGSEDGFAFEVPDEACDIEAGDAFLLCSDGLWEWVGDHDIETALQQATSVERWLEALEQHVLAHDAPDRDNYSAIGIWICAREG